MIRVHLRDFLSQKSVTSSPWDFILVFRQDIVDRITSFYQMLIVFSPKEILLDINTSSISITVRQTGLLWWYFFSISTSPNVKNSLPVFICDYKCFIFLVKSIFCNKFMTLLVTSANSAHNNTEIIKTSNV